MYYLLQLNVHSRNLPLLSRRRLEIKNISAENGLPRPVNELLQPKEKKKRVKHIALGAVEGR